MGNFFHNINVFKYTLKLKFEKIRDVFRDVLVIFSSTDQFPYFFLPFLLHHYNLMLSCRWQMIYQRRHKEKQFILKILYRLFLFVSRVYQLSSISGSLSLSSSYATFLYFFGGFCLRYSLSFSM